MDDFIIFSGNSNPVLSQKICEYINVPLGGEKVKRFSDGEIQIEIDENVRSKDVFVIQSTCSPVNENLVELLLMLDALKRASADRITAVIPYYGYARQDKKVAPRVPIKRQTGCGYTDSRRCNQDHYNGSACWADSGFFQYSGGQSFCCSGYYRLYQKQL